MTTRPWTRPSAFSDPPRDEPPPAEAPASLEEAAGRDLSNAFLVERVLARAAGSIVCAARERDGDRRVAVRVLRRPRTDTKLDTRLRELVVATALDHPHIVPIYRAGTTAGLVWYSMKLVEGRSLATLLAQGGPLDLPSTLRIAEQVANALAYAHRRGVVHGDLRPANVLMDRDWALVTDFAVGRLLDRYGVRDNPAGRMRAAYRAPEEGLGADPTQAGDQYALAATIWTCLTGTPPVEGPEADPPPMLPHPLAAALQRALRPRPAARYPSVLDFATALAVPETPAYVAPPRRPPSAEQRVMLVDDPPRVGRPFLAAAVIVLAALAGLGVMQLPQVRAAAPAAPVAPTPAPAAPAPSPKQTTTARTLPPLPPLEWEQPAPQDDTPPAQASAPRAPAAPAQTRPEPRPAVQGSGSLVISSMPWGRLYVDGQPAGDTPNPGLPLSPGPHRIEIVRSGYHTFRVEVYVNPGQEVRLVNIVLEAVLP
jgi:serine/threonine-protein kinase